MFSLSSRRYTGAKTKLLTHIESSLLKHSHIFKGKEPLSFFDVFAGTGVVSGYFLKYFSALEQNTSHSKPQPSQNLFFSNTNLHFNHFFINDFLESNFVIYQGFFANTNFEIKKLESIKARYNALESVKIKENYFSHSFGNTFFSLNDSKLIGFIRDDLDKLLARKMINQKEFFILLASLIYSSDKIANTVGHYDAYRKNMTLQDRFYFELIKPFKHSANIDIFKQDSNVLARDLAKHFNNKKLDIAFIDPPYNSRQYSRFYHLLETLAKNDKPELHGIARKRASENMSEYCKINAFNVFKDLITTLSHYTRLLIVTYNNTYTSKSGSSQNKISLKQIQQTLQSIGKTSLYDYDFKPFSSGKTDINAHFKNHKEMIFICEVNNLIEC